MPKRVVRAEFPIDGVLPSDQNVLTWVTSQFITLLHEGQKYEDVVVVKDGGPKTVPASYTRWLLRYKSIEQEDVAPSLAAKALQAKLIEIGVDCLQVAKALDDIVAGEPNEPVLMVEGDLPNLDISQDPVPPPDEE